MLTNREKQIIDAVAHGLTNKQAAKMLNISPSTVNVYLMRIFEKLNLEPELNTRIKAVLIYLRDYKGIKGLDEYINGY